MSQRLKRSTKQPTSYKTFSETGKVTEAVGMEHNRIPDEITTENQDVSDSQLDRENVANLVSLADHISRLTPERHGERQKLLEIEQEELALHVDPEDDDLDLDSHPKDKATGMEALHINHETETELVEQENTVNTISLASITQTNNPHNHDNLVVTIGMGKGHAEQHMLQHVQRETRRVEEVKQRDKEKKRSVKNTMKTPMKTPRKSRSKNNDNKKAECSNNTIVMLDSIQNRVQEVKDRVRELNPVRRSRALRYDDTGNNNPNVPGQNNGLNAWLDMQLSEHELTTDEQVMVNYGKKNSDQNRCFDIDDFPMKGLPPSNNINADTHPLANTVSGDIAQRARKLIDEDNISICRNTGVRFARNNNRQPPSAAMGIVPQEPTQDMGLPSMTRDRPRPTPQYKRVARQAEVFNVTDRQGYDDRDRYTSDWDEHDEIPQQYHDDINDNQYIEEQGQETEYTDRYESSPERPMYRNPEPYLDEPFRFRSRTRRTR